MIPLAYLRVMWIHIFGIMTYKTKIQHYIDLQARKNLFALPPIGGAEAPDGLACSLFIIKVVLDDALFNEGVF
jgi:hypothetical protein